MAVIVRVVADANGGYTPHNGRYVLHWNPHTEAGVLELDSVKDPNLAYRFVNATVAGREWQTVSHVQATRPWDGKPNRPLTGVTIELVKVYP